jgi:hypothetical protein
MNEETTLIKDVTWLPIIHRSNYDTYTYKTNSGTLIVTEEMTDTGKHIETIFDNGYDSWKVVGLFDIRDYTNLSIANAITLIQINSRDF